MAKTRRVAKQHGKWEVTWKDFRALKEKVLDLKRRLKVLERRQ